MQIYYQKRKYIINLTKHEVLELPPPPPLPPPRFVPAIDALLGLLESVDGRDAVRAI